MSKPHIVKHWNGWVASLNEHHSIDESPVAAYWKLVDFMKRRGTWPAGLPQ